MKKTMALVFVLIISGCTNFSAKKPDVNYSPSIVDTLNRYYDASEKGLISPARLFSTDSNPGVVDGDKYRMFKRWWCLDSNSSKVELVKLVSAHCSGNGGVLISDWCSDKTTESPIYKVSVGGGGLVDKSGGKFCTGAEDVGVLAYERSSKASERDWLLVSNEKLGFVTPSKYTERQRVEQEVIWRSAVNEVNKQAENAKLVLASNRGTRVCREFDQGKFVYVGYVEDKTDQKIKVSVAQAVYKRDTRISLGGFQPTVVWEYPEGWYVCE